MNWSLLLSTLGSQVRLTLEEFLFLQQFDFWERPQDLASFLEIPSLKHKVLRVPDWWQMGLRALEEINRRGGHVVYPGHPNYPIHLLETQDPPIFLSYLGHPTWKERKCISVVGARDPSVAALRWLDQHGGPLCAPPFSIVSGGARGIDQKAHALALRAGQPTIAFLPSGLSKIYPPSFADWIEPILQHQGALVSEFLPQVEMRTFHFHQRNRLICGMSRCLFVVEARRASGSMMTARLALESGRNVCVLPAFPNDELRQGTLDLLFEGANPLRDADDLQMFLNLNS